MSKDHRRAERRRQALKHKSDDRDRAQLFAGTNIFGDHIRRMKFDGIAIGCRPAAVQDRRAALAAAADVEFAVDVATTPLSTAVSCATPPVEIHFAAIIWQRKRLLRRLENLEAKWEALNSVVYTVTCRDCRERIWDEIDANNAEYSRVRALYWELGGK